MYRKKTLFVLAMALLLLVGFMSTSLISYFVAHDSLSKQIAGETLPLTSDNIYSEIQRDLLRPVLISSLMAHDTFVRNWTLAGEENPAKIRQYLAEIQEKYDTVTAFFVSDATGRYYHSSGILKEIDPDNPEDAWYARVREMNAPYEINVDADTADRSRLTIFINYRVHDYEGNYIGATGVGLSVDAVADLIRAYQRRYGRQIYFVDREGDVTLHGNRFEGPLRLQERPGLGRYATRILTNPSTSFTYQAPDAGKVYVNSRLVPEFDWFLLVEQRGDPGETRIQKTLFVNLGLSVLITLVVGLIAHFTLRGYQRRLERMATTDKLTGAASRQVFDTLFDHALKTARRKGQSLALLNIDIDHFKRINDRYGHQGGDVAIRSVANIIRQETRESDILCRWGGEEFLVLMEDATLDDAATRAESVRRAVAKRPVAYGRERIDVTLSIGVAELRKGEDLGAIISRSDAALYEAKAAGRNAVRRD
jgi:diguanylate cyclase (GGDEF)-like protein